MFFPCHRIDLPSILKRLWTAGIVATLLLFMFNTLSASFFETTDVVAAFDPNVLRLGEGLLH